jgi:predicted transcriptional regulator
MRVNARLDETTQQQLDYLAQATGQSVSHVVRESVAHYYAEVKRQRSPSRFLAMAGKGDSGRSDVASNVKAQLTEILEHKFGLAPLTPSASSAPASTRPLASASPARKARGRA